MKKPIHPVRKVLDGAQKRFIRSRPGSVLILVVALLVLMALIGTAYMTMAQFDRFSSAQHGFNTEVDLLLDGVINMTRGTVASGVFLKGQFRPGNPTYNNNPPQLAGVTTYNNYDSLGLDPNAAAAIGGTPGTPWLGSRVPELLPGQNTPSPTTINWPFISAALNGGGTFDTPYWPAGTVVRYSTRNAMIPGATATQVDGAYQPAFLGVPGVGTVMAADADGDGAADSGLFKLPVGTVEGITYYAAVRIVDNCAAINASIATRPNPTVALTPAAAPYTALPGDFSPVNLDLEGMIPTGGSGLQDLYAVPTVGNPQGLLSYRFNSPTPPAAVQNPVATPFNDTGATRTDFSYMLYPLNGFNLAFDQQWNAMGSRMDNPGNITAGTGINAKYQALPISESLSMARGFILRDPTVASSMSSPSVLEQRMPNATYNYSASAPYLPGNTAGTPTSWFESNFYYNTGANTTNMPMRALLVARNPVSNFVPGKFAEKGVSATGTGAFNFADMITFNGHRFVCINPSANVPAPTLDAHFQDPNWALEPWTSAPTKISVNTGTFQQLYTAYWAVMADQFVSGTGWQPAFPSGTDKDGRMFRNPIRGPVATAVLTPQQVMYVRAAIAAVNTMDLRDSDDDVTSRTITIPGAVAPGPQGGVLKATVYGMEKQPYITQVFARNDQKPENDWVGIELYNPYPTAIAATGNWVLASLDRTKLGMTASPWTLVSTFGTATPAITSIPAGGRVVFISNKTPTNVTLPAAWPTTGVQVAVVANLTKALAQELFILRPRYANGAFRTSTATNDTYSESATNYNDLVPVDSYDFTNLPSMAPPPMPPATASGQEWGYIRPSVSPQKNWHFVYPGPWDATAKAVTVPPTPTQGGTLSEAAVSPKTLITLTLGTAQGTVIAAPPPALPYQDVPLQINNVDFAGPLKVNQTTPTGPNYFPFGAFARNGDILDVTYIGSYKIWSGDASSERPWEFNTVSMDSAMATAIDVAPFTPLGTSVLAAENIGRFCPIDKHDAAIGGYDDLQTTSTNLWAYHWATRLFDYLTVQSPQDDYLPNAVDPWVQDLPFGSWRYFPASKGLAVPMPVPNSIAGVKNTYFPNGGNPPLFNTNNITEETAPVNGLVNINTAPWRVLAAVPWTPASVANYQTTNASIAQAIVYYRDVNDGSGTHGHGPFKSIFELNDVPYPIGTATILRDQFGNAAAFQTPQYGYISPIVPPPAASNTYVTTGDFEQQFQTMARVSNLLTTHSDSYTAYILVQGWRNAETNAPHLVVQRRAAIIIDRSSITPTNTAPTSINVPVD